MKQRVSAALEMEKIMGKKVLVIVSSPRKNGNSETLADRFIAGADQAGNITEKICLRDYKINYCIACEYHYKLFYTETEHSWNGRLFIAYEETAAGIWTGHPDGTGYLRGVHTGPQGSSRRALP